MAGENFWATVAAFREWPGMAGNGREWPGNDVAGPIQKIFILAR